MKFNKFINLELLSPERDIKTSIVVKNSFYRRKSMYKNIIDT